MKRHILLFLLGLTLLVAAGCSKNVILLSQADLSSLPSRVVHDVVKIPQYDNYSCATTSLAMALTYFEGMNQNPLDKETAWKVSGTDVQSVRTKGNDMAGLERLAQHYGYSGEFMTNLTIRQLEYILSRDVLAVLNIRVSANMYHAILATGYNRDDELVYVVDPSGPRTLLKYSDLENRWSAHLSYPPGIAYRSAFLIYPKGRRGF